VYYQDILHPPRYTSCTLPSVLSMPHALLTLQREERKPGLREGGNPWVRGEERVKVVNPVGRERQLCAELLRFSQ